jgi:hypothetical protein
MNPEDMAIGHRLLDFGTEAAKTLAKSFAPLAAAKQL